MKFSKYNMFINYNREKELYLLFNSLTGTTYKIDKKVKEKIELKDINSFKKEIVDQYKSSGIIIDDNIEEERYFSYLYNKSKFTSEILSLTILLTNECNLRCVYCFQGAGETNKGSLTEDSRENIYKFIKNQAESNKSKIINLTLFGGEPLLRFNKNIEWLDKIKKYCDDTDKTLITGLVTNGTLITNQILDNLKKYNCTYIQITLDGLKELHDKRRMYKNGKGSFEEVMGGMKMVYDRDDFNKPIIRINIDKKNYEDAYDIIKYLAEEKLTLCNVDFGIVTGNTEACSGYSGNCLVEEELGDILEKLWLKLKEFGFSVNIKPNKKSIFCGLYNDNSFTIAPNGEVYKCWEHVGENDHLIGKINKDGIIDSYSYAFFDWMSRNPLETDECKECVYLPACGGGCGSISYSKSKSYHSTGCMKTKGIIEKKIYHHFKNTFS